MSKIDVKNHIHNIFKGIECVPAPAKIVQDAIDYAVDGIEEELLTSEEIDYTTSLHGRGIAVGNAGEDMTTASSYWQRSDYIPVEEGDVVTLYAGCVTNTSAIATYMSENATSCLRTVQGIRASADGNKASTYTITIADGERYIRASSYNNLASQYGTPYLKVVKKAGLKVKVEEYGKMLNVDYNRFSYEGVKLSLTSQGYIKRFGKIKSYNGGTAQGIAIYNNILFVLFNNGKCTTYQLDENDNVTQIGDFTLDSASQGTLHCNTASFYPTKETGYNFPLLYIANGEQNKCRVERVTSTSSTLVQTITLNLTVATQGNNVFVGDDGYLYTINKGQEGDPYVYIKLRCPLLSEGDVVLSDSDIIDQFNGELMSSQYLGQGAICHNGYIIHSFGEANGLHKLSFYSVEEKKLVNELIWINILQKKMKE